jgi:ATP/maltotriose-dependent transcriptional regulator MalT
VQLARLTKRQARDMVERLAAKGRQAGTPAPLEQEGRSQEEQSNGVAQASLPVHLIPNEVLEQIVARADGMPLYLEELTKTLLESGTAWNVEAIPASLADSLMARLDRLLAAKEVAQRAAVLGREFGYPLLAAMVGMDEAALRHGLGRLVDAEILFARGEPPAAAYTFKHALILQMAIGVPLMAARGQSHPEYERTFSRARELASQIGESPELPRVLTGMAVAYFVKGDLATAAEVAQEALAGAERAGESFDLLSAHSVAGAPLLFQGNFPRARARELVVLAEQLGFPLLLGVGRVLRGRHRGDATTPWRSPGGKRPRRSSCAPPPAWRGSGSARASAAPPVIC